MRYTKKPVTIDAWPTGDLLRDIEKYPSKVPEPVREAIIEGILVPYGTGITIRTLEGDMEATGDDMLIRGIKGEFYPCRADIFEESYERATVAYRLVRALPSAVEMNWEDGDFYWADTDQKVDWEALEEAGFVVKEES